MVSIDEVPIGSSPQIRQTEVSLDTVSVFGEGNGGNHP